MPFTYTIDGLRQLNIDIPKPSIIFLYWDLWAWKTTLSSVIIQKLLNSSKEITSPTYVYYNKYDDIYHFDLYRLESYDQFVSIGWEEILDNNVWIILVEWPERIEKHYKADIEIYLAKTSDDDTRKIDIIYKKKAS
jgi:tRNA threonylcarbamoyladenosine biosynthesis protein TsaE